MATPEGSLRISVVIPTRNRLPLLRFCLASLEAQDAPPADHEIVVVDDGSEDGTAQWLAGVHPRCALSVLRLPQGVGRSSARNRGLAAAAGEIVLFLDGDVIAPPSLLSAHRRHHAQWGGRTCVSGYPWCWRPVFTWDFPDFTPGQRARLRRLPAHRRPAAVTPEVLAAWPAFERWAGGPLAPAGTRARLADPEAAPFLWFITADVSVRRDFVAEAGAFDERFQGHGLEDWELGYRLWKRGARFISDPSASVFHQEHPPRERTPRDHDHNYALFLDRHPEAEVALMAVTPPWADMAAYGRACAACRHLRRAAPTLAAALGEVLVAHARATLAGGEVRPKGWSFWTDRWGNERTYRVLEEQQRLLGDLRARPGIHLLQRLTGLTRA